MKKETTILFDLSGVLVELAGLPDFVKWTGKDPEEIAATCLASSAVRDFESGYMAFKDFHREFVKEWGVDISHDSLKVDKYFKSQYASHIIGKIKPDIVAYKHVVNSLSVPSNSIVFLDDSVSNVKAAIKVGLQAFQVKGAQGGREVLAKNGCI